MNSNGLKHSNNPKYQDNVLLLKTFEFSLDVIKYCDKLETLKKWSISNQVLRSGTSIGANCREAQNAESKRDFIHKLKIALKEADETEYWLFLCAEQSAFPKTETLIEALGEIISTTFNNMNAK